MHYKDYILAVVFNILGVFHLRETYVLYEMNFEALWDKNMSLADYQAIICPEVCFGDEKISLTGRNALVEQNFLSEQSYLMENMSSIERSFFMKQISSDAERACPDVKCFPCDCQKPRCQIYGTCCPEVHLLPAKDGSSTFSLLGPSPFSHADITTTEEDMDRRRRIKVGFYSGNQYTYLFISSCPDNYTDQNVRRMCEDDDLDDVFEYQLMDKVTKVVDPVTGITYFNRYCAECNNVTQMASWTTYIECDHYLYLYKAITEIDFYKLSLRPGSSCNVTEFPSSNVSNHLYFETADGWIGQVIDQCNVTGQWKVYDRDVASACFKMPGFVYTVSKENLRYSNVFCAICNSESYPYFNSYCRDNLLSPQFHGDLPFSVLLNFQSSMLARGVMKLLSCSKNEWAGPGGQCFPTRCAEGKVRQGNICKTALTRIHGLGYTSKLLYGLSRIPDKMISTDHEDLQNFTSALTSELSFWFYYNLMGIAKEMAFKINMTYISSESPADGPFLRGIDYKVFVLIEAKFIAGRYVTRDVFEDLVTDRLLRENVTLAIGDALVRLEYIPDPLFRSSNFDCSVTTVRCWSSENINISTIENKMWALKSDFLSLNDLVACPYVRFNKSNVILTSEANLARYALTLRIEDAEFTFVEKTELMSVSSKDDTVDICVEILTEKLQQWHERKPEPSGVFISLYVITVLCLSVSMLCLVITLITYACFQALRSTAGIHNMFLSSSLLLAQVLLLAISHMKAPGQLCTALAVLAHYAWLCMFTWTFLCCFHMYAIFTAKNRTIHSNTESRSRLIKRVAVSLLVPAVIVATVIAVDASVSGGERIGYGHGTCFLNSVELTAIFMATPLSVVLVSNAFFFVSSVLEIYKIKRLQVTGTFKSTDRGELYIYIKLSTVTGVFWVLALLAEGLDNDPLRYVSALMNGLQGFFIFVSYVCNRRVMALYIELWFRSKDKQLSANTTFSRLASELHEQRKTKEETI